MRLHPHIWKYFSSKHRICRVCGEPETYEKMKGFDESRWYSSLFDTWVKEYPVQVLQDVEEKRAKTDIEIRLEDIYEADRRKGREFLRRKKP